MPGATFKLLHPARGTLLMSLLFPFPSYLHLGIFQGRGVWVLGASGAKLGREPRVFQMERCSPAFGGSGKGALHPRGSFSDTNFGNSSPIRACFVSVAA